MPHNHEKDDFELRTTTTTKTQFDGERGEWIVEQYHRHSLVCPECGDQWIDHGLPTVDDTPYRRLVFKADEVVDDPDETRIE